ncbi:hypothetical protein DFH07DRAFT_993441 [Mycena maculata]|uniref:Uncharacterized protein n=1 Tax=Mycena maculata TaxID=230809 RepID=A0AAD7JVH8_9AGAR|nr:hypothetical protein DFH07DRAFT_993441 [Mycena maculata]
MQSSNQTVASINAPRTTPHLPVELITEIIETLWHMRLSSRERIAFLWASYLVNSTWADVFDLVSSRDVYIPSELYCDYFISRLRGLPFPTADEDMRPSRPPTFLELLLAPSVPGAPAPSLLSRFLRACQGTKAAPSQAPPAKASLRACSANLACQSLTFEIVNLDVLPDRGGHLHAPVGPILPMGPVLEALLAKLKLRVPSLAPNLRRLCIEYIDTDFSDVFQRGIFSDLPAQITHLELRYAFSPATPDWIVEPLRAAPGRRRKMSAAETVTALSVLGAGNGTVMDALRGCPNARVLKVDDVRFRLQPSRLGVPRGEAGQEMSDWVKEDTSCAS